MQLHNPENERIKRAYFSYLAEAQGYSVATVDAVAKAINRLEVYTKFRSFKAFHIEQAKGFKASLAEQTSLRTKDRLSKATLHSTLSALKRFFVWLAGQPGYKSRISYADAEYFNLSSKEVRIAKARHDERVPTLEQIRHVLELMPVNTEIELRDRALIAFTILTGARDRAIASMKLKYIDLERKCVVQDARQVDTKFSKSFTTWFFPVGGDIAAIVVAWVDHLRKEKLWGIDDPLFPATKLVVGTDHRFEACGLARSHWKNAGPIRRIFKEAFIRAGLAYFNPHSFRKTLVQLGEKRCRNPEQFKAWAQNLGHENVLTTFASYGAVAAGRQGEIIVAELVERSGSDDREIEELAQKLARAARRSAL